MFKWLINNFLKQKLKLELHPEKSRVIPLHNGVNLLGFRVFYYYKLPRKSNIRNFERKLSNFYTLAPERERENNYENLIKYLEGWFGYVMHGNTYKMRKRILEQNEWVV